MTNPIWVLNTRMVVKKDEDGKPAVKRGTLETAAKILRDEGVQGFFQGLLPALVLVINPIIQYTAFERFKAMLAARKSALNALDFFLLGAVSKLCATTITYPYIVIKSRMQIKQGGDESTRYNSIADGLRKIIKAEGVAGLYKGIESKLLQSVLSAAFMFAFKEELFGTSVWLLTLLKMREAKAASSA
jgi:adenine nucleotide transporter 17